MTVGDICTRTVITADPDETIVEAARRMRDKHVGALVVIDAARRPVGILTDRDIVVSALAQSPDRIGELRTGDVMSVDPATALSYENVDEALRRMRALGFRRLPIVSGDGQLIGIVTFDDVLESFTAELRQLTAVVGVEQKRERVERK